MEQLDASRKPVILKFGIFGTTSCLTFSSLSGVKLNLLGTFTSVCVTRLRISLIRRATYRIYSVKVLPPWTQLSQSVWNSSNFVELRPYKKKGWNNQKGKRPRNTFNTNFVPYASLLLRVLIVFKWLTKCWRMRHGRFHTNVHWQGWDWFWRETHFRLVTQNQAAPHGLTHTTTALNYNSSWIQHPLTCMGSMEE